MLSCSQALHSYRDIPFVQVGKDSVECIRDCVMCGSVRVLYELE
jgi:hypothetical protein